MKNVISIGTRENPLVTSAKQKIRDHLALDYTYYDLTYLLSDVFDVDSDEIQLFLSEVWVTLTDFTEIYTPSICKGSLLNEHIDVDMVNGHLQLKVYLDESMYFLITKEKLVVDQTVPNVSLSQYIDRIAFTYQINNDGVLFYTDKFSGFGIYIVAVDLFKCPDAEMTTEDTYTLVQDGKILSAVAGSGCWVTQTSCNPWYTKLVAGHVLTLYPHLTEAQQTAELLNRTQIKHKPVHLTVNDIDYYTNVYTVALDDDTFTLFRKNVLGQDIPETVPTVLDKS